MNEDFQARLARLDAKANGPGAQSSSASPTSPRRPTGATGSELNKSGPRIFKYIIAGVTVLFGLPIAAVFATMFYSQNKDSLDELFLGFGFSKTAYVADSGDTESRDARREMGNVAFQLGTGSTFQGEGENVMRLDGRAQLIETQKNSLNLDAMRDKATEISGKN